MNPAVKILLDIIGEQWTEIDALRRKLEALTNPSASDEGDAWKRLYADYRRYRNQVGYPKPDRRGRQHAKKQSRR